MEPKEIVEKLRSERRIFNRTRGVIVVITEVTADAAADAIEQLLLKQPSPAKQKETLSIGGKGASKADLTHGAKPE